MFSLIYGLIEYIFRKDEYHIIILGVDHAGKTNLLERIKSLYTEFFGLEPSKITPTVGLNVGRVEAFKSCLMFWDLGGQQGLRSIWDKYYDESHAIIYVVDSADQKRFAESKVALDKLLGHRALFGAPLLLMANKQDLEDAVSSTDVSEHFGIGKLDSRPCKVQPICAHSGEGIKDGIAWLVEAIKCSSRAERLRYHDVH